MLRFIGRGSGFSDDHNCAYFMRDDSLILMDCSMTAFIKIKNAGLKYFEEREPIKQVIVLVTHTHGDHIGGIPMLIHYARFIWKIPIIVIAPSEEVKQDMEFYLNRIDGCKPEAYSLHTVEDSGLDWLKMSIPTRHVPELEGRCFGYKLEIAGKSVVYTGDTATLDTFMPYIEEDSYLYTECSFYKTNVHLNVDALLELKGFFEANKVRVYLMHLDNEDGIWSRVQDTEMELAPLVDI